MKFEPWWSETEAEHATSGSRRLPTNHNIESLLMLLGTSHKLKYSPIKLCCPFFVTADMLKKIFDYIPQFLLSKCCARSKSKQNYKNSHHLMAEPLNRRLCVHQYQEIMRKNDPPLPPCQFFFLMDSSQKLIRSSEIPREQPYQI